MGCDSERNVESEIIDAMLDRSSDGVNMDITYAISNSLGFGGHNASLLVKKFEE